MFGPPNIQDYKNLKREKSNTDGYMILSIGYAESSFGDFERYLRIIVGLNGDDIQLILKQYTSHFITNGILLGSYSTKDISEIVYTEGDRPGAIQLEYDDISMKTDFVSRQFSGIFTLIGMLRFD